MDGLPPPKQAILIYRFPFPKSKPVNLAKIFASEDNTSKDNLAQTTSLRNDFCAAIETDVAQTVLLASEKYFPSLFGFVQSVEENPKLRLTGPLSIDFQRWKSHSCRFFLVHLLHSQIQTTILHSLHLQV